MIYPSYQWFCSARRLSVVLLAYYLSLLERSASEEKTFQHPQTFQQALRAMLCKSSCMIKSTKAGTDLGCLTTALPCPWAGSSPKPLLIELCPTCLQSSNAGKCSASPGNLLPGSSSLLEMPKLKLLCNFIQSLHVSSAFCRHGKDFGTSSTSV